MVVDEPVRAVARRRPPRRRGRRARRRAAACGPSRQPLRGRRRGSSRPCPSCRPRRGPRRSRRRSRRRTGRCVQSLGLGRARRRGDRGRAGPGREESVALDPRDDAGPALGATRRPSARDPTSASLLGDVLRRRPLPRPASRPRSWTMSIRIRSRQSSTTSSWALGWQRSRPRGLLVSGAGGSARSVAVAAGCAAILPHRRRLAAAVARPEPAFAMVAAHRRPVHRVCRAPRPGGGIGRRASLRC